MSLKVVISNQRGGVSKTTTTTTLAREFADRGKRVLVIDTDPQGSISSILNLKPEYGLYNFVIERLIFDDCIVRVNENLHVTIMRSKTVRIQSAIEIRTCQVSTVPLERSPSWPTRAVLSIHLH